LIIPELSIPSAGQKDRGLWERDWFARRLHVLLGSLAVFQLVVVNQQQPQMREKRNTNIKQVCSPDPFGLQLYV